MSQLSLKNVNKIYPNGFHAVHDFCLDIKDKEFIVFVGPSGCGKSTTLRMIAGLENISSGEFQINGVRANEKGPRDRGVAMVFQSYALYPHFSVYDNLSFGLTLQGIDEETIEEKVNATAKILGLTDYLDRKPRELSGGQRQRVAVGRAIIRKVDIFLMDEPLSNLDAKQRVTMRSEITQIHRETKATTIYVTHDQTEAMTMADRIVVMKDGYIQQIGTPYELYFKPVNKFVGGFIGEPPMNFIKVRISEGKLVYPDGTVISDASIYMDNAAGYEGKEIYMGFRPEACELHSNEGLSFSGQVELTELLGDNTNVYANLGEQKIILKINPYDTPVIGSEFEFHIPHDKIYLFDGETENIISK